MLTLVYSFDTSPLQVLGHLCIITVQVFRIKVAYTDIFRAIWAG